jgi:tRNA1(Val) A37 N6-methylase TrmN6
MIQEEHRSIRQSDTDDIRRPDESINGLFRNKVRVIQAERGYRVSEDAVLLTWFVRPRENEAILDAGTGCGAIAFGLAVKEPSAEVVGIEIQAGLADRAARGVKLNGLDARVSIIRADFRPDGLCFRSGSFHTIVSNPPYHEAGKGRINLQQEKAVARHQLMMPLPDLLRTSRELLRPDGRFALIYPADRIDQVQRAGKDAGFAVTRMLWIHAQRGTPPCLVCVEARPSDRQPVLIEDRLFLYDGAGTRTQEAEAILDGEDIPDRPA